ncbi:hypothetical protein Taro_048733 [Colocasia esculenta]|uniref:Uncharacterized protein n=1 Tax=Colocasia esculenta TaxID=4460 RepID=A0A843X8W9_COLES|nr:hypothetical protein [Colocasia esculenta]
MAYDSNMGFHQGMIPSSFYDHHMVSFQSGAVSGSNRLFPSAINTIDAINSMDAMVYTATPSGNNMSLMIPSESTAGVLHLDPVPGLKHDTGLAVDWSLEEQASLERGLVKYSNEPNIMKYIKIAATLHNKTVRDVALRCRWMTNKENVKRRKLEEYCAGKKMKDRKNYDPLNLQLSFIHSDGYFIFLQYQVLMGQCNCYWRKRLNFYARLKLQDNVDLFFHTKNNVTAILKRMHETPGIMSRMPPLPESMDEKLFDTLLCAPQLSSVQFIG